ncbi:hypothetical protein Indivirus_1_139 [Indivirus ILV1]|uniref:Uncharacterized protein n=1 Tax=Indivirus ILV1 TaxID=1977633 RepID=A0A1V0SCS8_9VIRU|nr:hypothetical protein Indivirus_1_139 [Indivirus ILV1]
MSFLNNIVTTLAAPVNATMGKVVGVNVLPIVEPDEALIYTECIGGSNISVKHVSLKLGSYVENDVKKIGPVVGVRPGKNVQVTLFNIDSNKSPLTVTNADGDKCLPVEWQGKVKSLSVTKTEQSHETKKSEGFGGNTVFMLLNILLVLLVLFVIYRLVA